ncbi:MAG: asparagine synthase (glutamine-hydrolyzing) [Deltaproteobacteria bacterium]|nr:asparagine synthase (glutamine-hydrolyzing) [Deltaproteobacteria bacterium]
MVGILTPTGGRQRPEEAVICGICGVARSDRAVVEAERLGRMVHTLHHRGPDDQGTWSAPGVGLAQARLSILDLSPAGHQPMRSADGRYWISFNGEIYNFQELREVLLSLGYTFRSSGDTDVLLAAWAAWGPACLDRLDGMFAFALWDSATEELHLVRDRFGIKPLYYSVADGQLLFGSEIKAILAGREGPPALEERSLHEYLYYGTTHGEHTLFAGVKKLLAGSRAVWKAGRLDTTRWWFPERLVPLQLSVEEAEEELRWRLERAVRLHLVSDVPVGVFLSSGVDSSGITALAARAGGQRLHTFSAGFDMGKGQGELPAARALAARLGTEHHELWVKTDGLPDVIEALVYHHDQPFGDAAHIPLYLLTKALDGAVKVVLQGDGGDEIFGGYPKYVGLRRAALLLRAGMGGARARAVDRLLRMVPPPWADDLHLRNLRRKVNMLGQDDDAQRMGLFMAGASPAFSPTVALRDGLRQRVERADPFHRYRLLQPAVAGRDLVEQGLYLDAQVLLSDWFLEKVDRSTMAHSVEVRVPFLDSELATWAMRLPSSYKVRGTEKKWLLRRALRGVVPDEVLDAPKRGFGVPFLKWLSGPLEPMLREELSSASMREWVDPVVVGRMLDARTGDKHPDGVTLYRLLQLALWKRRYHL